MKHEKIEPELRDEDQETSAINRMAYALIAGGLAATTGIAFTLARKHFKNAKDEAIELNKKEQEDE